MEIRLTTALQPIQPSKAISSLLERLRPGENISAVVEAQLAEDSFLLKLGDSGEAVRARSQLELRPGQTLKLEVVRLGATPELKIVPQEPGSAAETPEGVAIQQALRQFLPKQGQLGELATNLRQALSPPANQNAAALPEPLRALVKSVLQALPQKTGLMTPEGLKQAAADSGLFLEARLAAHPEVASRLAAQDLKGSLLALGEALKGMIKAAEAQPTANPAPARPGEPPATASPSPAQVSTPSSETTGKPASIQAPTQLPQIEGAPAKPLTPGEQKPIPQALIEAGAEQDKAAHPLTRPPTPGVAMGDDQHAAPGSAAASVPDDLGTPDKAAQALPPEAKAPNPKGLPEAPTPSPGPGNQAKAPETASTKPPELVLAKPSQTETGDTASALSKASTGVITTAKEGQTPGLNPLPLPETPKASPRTETSLPSQALASEEHEPPKPLSPDAGGRGETVSLKEVVVRSPQANPPVPSGQVMAEEATNLKTLQHHTEGAIARIVLDQLASLPQAEGKPMVWQMEIPYLDDDRSDTAKLKVVREHARDTQTGQAFWSVILELSPPGLGTIHSRINLLGDRIDTYFWSDLGTTSNLIQQHLDLLAARMQQAGLQVGELNTLPGAPTDSGPGGPPVPRLLDERA